MSETCRYRNEQTIFADTFTAKVYIRGSVTVDNPPPYSHCAVDDSLNTIGQFFVRNPEYRHDTRDVPCSRCGRQISLVATQKRA